MKITQAHTVLARVVGCALMMTSANATAGSASGLNNTDVTIPDGPGTYVHSPITISSAPSGATVTRIDWSFNITHADGRDLDVDLNDNTRTSAFHADLWRGTFAGGTDSGANPARAGTITSGVLIGLPVNQTWYLAAADVLSPDQGFINSWSITVYWADLQPNLTPYQPSGWSDKIVVSRTTGNNTDSTDLTTADTLYVDWAVINSGAGATAARFYTELYVDGAFRNSWFTDPPLNANFYTSLPDYSIGTLSAGMHTIRVTTDAGGAISESNESDNSYTKTISVGTPPQPNLTPYQPSGWSDKIVVSRTTGTSTDSTGLTTADTLYVDWAVINNGAVATSSRFWTELYVDGVLRQSWYTDPPLNANSYTSLPDYSIGSLSAGNHTLRIKTDATSAIAEGNESDNEYTKLVSVGTSPSPEILDIIYPSALALGQWADVAIRVRNNGGQADDGGISVSLPAFTASGDGAFAIDNGSSAGSLGYREFPQGSTIYHKSGSQISASYMLVEWGDQPWPANEENWLRLRVQPKAAGNFVLQIRSAMGGPGPYAGTPTSGPLDQQGWWVIQRTISVSATQPNLTPYQLSGWSDKIVVSRATGTTTDSTGLTTADTLYVDWAVLNNGVASTATRFWTELYLDGALRQSWYTDPPLDVNFYTSLPDFSIGSLSAGSHTLRIKTDATSAIAESNETDNEYTKTITVANVSMPDFVVTSISLSPSSPAAGQPFTATVTVRNQGLASGNGGWLDVWAHQSSVPACGTDGNAWKSVGTLTSGESRTFTLNLTAPASSGSYTVRAFVDSYCETTESSDVNNQTTLTYSVGTAAQRPDFLVTAVTLTPASPQPGQAFTASVTVRNQGLASGNGGYLDVWAHQPSVPACGTDGNTWASVGTLTAGESRTFALNLTAPASAGSYTFRAFADSYCQTSESSDANNQTTRAYTVAAPSQTPNFVVTAITFNPAQPVGGQPFTAYVTVRNQGTGSGDGRYLDVWGNQPSLQTCGADGDQYQSVGTLSANQSKTLTFNFTAPPSGAPWTFRAFVDSACQTTESSDADNQLAVSYGINPVAQPNFRITSIALSPGSLNPGDPFSANVTVRNFGAGSGNAGWLDVWASKSTTASCGDFGDGTSTVGILAPGQSKVVTIANLTAGTAGNNTLRAFVDSTCQSIESDESDNQSTYTYTVSTPDSFPIFVGILGGGKFELGDDPDESHSTWADSEIADQLAYLGPLDSQDVDDLRQIAAQNEPGGGLYALGYFFTGKANSRSFISDPGNSDLAKQDIDTFLNDHPGAKLFVAGHSVGGGDVQNLLGKLKTLGIDVELSGHIDSIELGDDSTIPSNTKRAMGFYQDDQIISVFGVEFPGERNLSADDTLKTTVSNTDIGQPIGPCPCPPLPDNYAYHRNMDNDERVWGVLLEYIKSHLP